MAKSEITIDCRLRWWAKALLYTAGTVTFFVRKHIDPLACEPAWLINLIVKHGVITDANRRSD